MMQLKLILTYLIKIEMNMKTVTLAFSLMLAGSLACFAQCDKTLIINSSKTQHLDAKGVVQHTDDETAVIELTKTALIVSVNGEQKISGKIISETCDWKVPFKEGKTVIKAAVTHDQDGQQRNVTVTIEGKDGKVTLLFEMEGTADDRIRVEITKFVEKTA
jgi:hypothetical protein